jgi:hypothetical protein
MAGHGEHKSLRFFSSSVEKQFPRRLKEDNDSVFIEGIPSMRFGQGMDCSFIRSVQLALQSLGDTCSYQYLMGISGAAFRIHFHPDWCPSSGDVTSGFDVSRPLFRNLGYNVESVAIDDNKFTDIKTFYGKITDHINRGVPVIAINLKACPEWGIITGYLKNKAGLLCRTYFDESDAYSRAERAPWLSMFIAGKQGSTGRSDKDLPGIALRQALMLLGTDQFGEYASGISAYDYWIGELQEMQRGSERDRLARILKVNRMLLGILRDARRSAYNFLVETLPEGFPNGPEITDKYRMLYRLLDDSLGNELPASEADPGQWTGGIIETQIGLLNRILELEREATGLIAASLDILD